jgi:hypothetical protein
MPNKCNATGPGIERGYSRGTVNDHIPYLGSVPSKHLAYHSTLLQKLKGRTTTIINTLNHDHHVYLTIIIVDCSVLSVTS